MKQSLAGIKVAVLVANGFVEQDMTSANKALIEVGAHVRIVSSENGLVNSWDGAGWGHHFAVDSPLSAALAADYHALVVPGGQRSLDKLKLTAHSRRFIASFISTEKPVALFDNAVSLMIFTDTVRDLTVGGPAELEPEILFAGGQWSPEAPCRFNHVMSGVVTEETRPAFISDMIDHFDMVMKASAGEPAKEIKAA